MIRVILFEDNSSLRENLSLVLSNTGGIQFTGAFAHANEAVARIHNHRPDVVLMDIQMPGISGIDALYTLKKQFPDIKVLMQTVFEDDHRIFSALCGGASGYILKTPDTDQLVEAIFEVHQGGTALTPSIAKKVWAMFQHQLVSRQPSFVPLTEKEKEVLNGMVNGMSYKMIADACGITFNTTRWHLKNIYQKLHVNLAPEAVRVAIENRIV